MLPLILILATFLHLTTSSTVTITEAPNFSSQRPCGQNCFYEDGYPQLGNALGCNLNILTNECFCRLDLQSQGDAFLYSCVGRSCSGNTLDISTATSIYDNYCIGAGFGTGAAATTTTEGSSTSQTSSFSYSIAPSTTQTSSTSSKTSSGLTTQIKNTTTTSSSILSSTTAKSGSGGSSNKVEIIGVASGLGGTFLTAVGVGMTWYLIVLKQRKGKSKEAGDQGAANASPQSDSGNNSSITSAQTTNPNSMQGNTAPVMTSAIV